MSAHVDDFQCSVRYPMADLDRPLVATHAIEETADAINWAIEVGYHGIDVGGCACFGKSHTATYLMRHPTWLVKWRAGFFVMEAPKCTKRTDKTFLTMFLQALNVRAPSRATQLELQQMVTGRLIEMCQSAGARLIIVFMDEAQNLVLSDWEYLTYIDNHMTRARYRFFLVSIHQRDVSGFSNESTHNLDLPPHIVCRFKVRSHEFLGLRNVEDTAYVLGRYDEATDWPPGSGTTYTQHYAPKAYAEGFRASSCAASLWKAAADSRTAASLPPEWTWPMKSFDGTVHHLLAVIAASTPQISAFTDDDLKDALRASDFLALERCRRVYGQ